MRFSGWILFVSRRFARVDRRGRSAVTTFLASLGICFGVMTLVTVTSVMNGFQMSFIDSIMEVSSYHVRVSGIPAEDEARFREFCGGSPLVVSATPFVEAQSLVVGRGERQAAAVVRAVPPNVRSLDEGFAREVKMWGGSFDIEDPSSIVLGEALARRLGVRVGSRVSLFALSGGADVELLSADRVFTVTGVFRTGYAEINSAYSFVSEEAGRMRFGEKAARVYGLKLSDTDADSRVVAEVSAAFPGARAESWKSFNRSFFGALRVEKNMLMVLVFLIFVVVGINIFSGMRRMVFERREEISVLSAFGGRRGRIQSIFVAQGFLVGAAGAVPGVVLGLLLCVRMPDVFVLMQRLVYAAQLFAVSLVSPESAGLVAENPMFSVYARIPPRVVPSEVVVIAVFGMFSALAASWAASRGILDMRVAEVMRDE